MDSVQEKTLTVNSLSCDWTLDNPERYCGKPVVAEGLCAEHLRALSAEGVNECGFWGLPFVGEVCPFCTELAKPIDFEEVLRSQNGRRLVHSDLDRMRVPRREGDGMEMTLRERFLWLMGRQGLVQVDEREVIRPVGWSSNWVVPTSEDLRRTQAEPSEPELLEAA